MRAVNLIPRDERGGGLGRSGRAAQALLGGLGLVLLIIVVYVLQANTVQDRRATLAKVDAELVAAKAEAARLKPFGDFAALRQARVLAVRTIADGRFDWARALRGLSVAMPSDVRLTTLEASVSGEGSGSSTGAPTMKLAGCTASQRSVSRMLAALRQVAGVEDLDLDSSDQAPKTEAAKSEAPGCATTFSLTVGFKAPPAPAGSAPGAAPAATTPSTTTAGTATTPAPSTTPAPPAASTAAPGAASPQGGAK